MLLKREIAILLLFCFSFYHFGYYFFYFSYRYKIENDWSTVTNTADREFSEAQMIKIPVHIPYLTEQENFSASNASFVKSGASYRIVKQRYVQDTLQVIYVPDIALNKLDRTIKGWITALTEGINQEASNGKIIPKNFIKDYLQPISFISFKPSLTDKAIGETFIFCCYSNIQIDLPDPPPEAPFV